MPVHINVIDQSERAEILVRRVCSHPNAEVVPPCCTTPDSDTGLISCGCGGQSTVECPDCDDQLDDETIEKILEGRS